MTTPAPPDDLTPPQREVFIRLRDLASRALAARGATLIPSDALVIVRVAQVLVLSRQAAEAGRLTDAAELVALGQELAGAFFVTIPPALLPGFGRA